jgi:hypothetical protein
MLLINKTTIPKEMIMPTWCSLTIIQVGTLFILFSNFKTTCDTFLSAVSFIQYTLVGKLKQYWLA